MYVALSFVDFVSIICLNNVTCLLKTRIAEPEETSIAMLQQPKQPAIAKQRLCKHVPTATETDVTVEELLETKHNNKETKETVLSMRYAPGTETELQSVISSPLPMDCYLVCVN
jgi:hypothetical protein